MVSRSVRLFSLTSVVPLVAGFSALMAVSVLAQLPASAQASNKPEIVRPMMLAGTEMNLEDGKRLMEEGKQAMGTQNYELAASKLSEARVVFNQLSHFYEQQAASYSINLNNNGPVSLDKSTADSLRMKALETAQMRDEANYQLALVYRAQNKPQLAIPLLVQITRSQQPTQELGQKAYQQLRELGYVNSP